MLRRLLVVLLFLLSACGSTAEEPASTRSSRTSTAGLKGAAIDLVTSEELEELAFQITMAMRAVPEIA